MTLCNSRSVSVVKLKTYNALFYILKKALEHRSEVRELLQTPPVQTLPAVRVWLPVQIKAQRRAASVTFHLCDCKA